jgi:hypothetical protein
MAGERNPQLSSYRKSASGHVRRPVERALCGVFKVAMADNPELGIRVMEEQEEMKRRRMPSPVHIAARDDECRDRGSVERLPMQVRSAA